MHSRQVLLRDERNLPVGVLEINRDITERKRTEQALRDIDFVDRNPTSLRPACM